MTIAPLPLIKVSLFEGSNAPPARPSNNIIQMMSPESRWSDADRGETNELGDRTVQGPFLSARKLTWTAQRANSG